MPRKGKKRRNVGSPQGDNLVVIAGLPKDTLQWIIRTLSRDTSQRPARYVGAPSQIDDWRPLYKRTNITETLKLIERENENKPPHRIIVLYIPSRGIDDLISSLQYVCFLTPLKPIDGDWPLNSDTIEWRHEKPTVKSIVYRTLQDALKTTNVLKAEITDNRTSPLSLPAHNFYFPNRHSTISHTYRDFVQQGFKMEQLKENLLPTRFTRDQLPPKAFKGSQYTDHFFQDYRGRVFPIDLHHAPIRYNDEECLNSSLSLVLRQRYRFGVTVRDGNLHYDVQYEYPRTLRKEPMHCAKDGDVLVTGSHANIGVNDVIWVPARKKEPQRVK